MEIKSAIEILNIINKRKPNQVGVTYDPIIIQAIEYAQKDVLNNLEALAYNKHIRPIDKIYKIKEYIKIYK